MNRADSDFFKANNSEENRYWNRLDSVLTKFLKRDNSAQIYYFQQLCQHWELVLGEKIAKKILPQRWQNNTLVLIMEDGSYVNFIRHRKSIILSQIRAVLQNDFCKDLKTVVGDPNSELKSYIQKYQQPSGDL